MMSDDVIKLFSGAADLNRAREMSSYMKNKFQFYGVSSPVRKKLCNDIYIESKKMDHDVLIEEAHVLWNHDKRECQYVAGDLLIKNKSRLLKTDIKDIQYFITRKSWWDTVDFLASHMVGVLFSKFSEIKEEYLGTWLNSDNIWLNRTCLIYQLKYGEMTDFDELKTNILTLKHKDEFFIQKAIGWSLRQYSKYNPTTVKEFIDEVDLSNLARREGEKYIK